MIMKSFSLDMKKIVMKITSLTIALRSDLKW